MNPKPAWLRPWVQWYPEMMQPNHFWAMSGVASNSPAFPGSDVGTLVACLCHFWVMSSVAGDAPTLLEVM